LISRDRDLRKRTQERAEEGSETMWYAHARTWHPAPPSIIASLVISRSERRGSGRSSSRVISARFDHSGFAIHSENRPPCHVPCRLRGLRRREGEQRGWQQRRRYQSR